MYTIVIRYLIPKANCDAFIAWVTNLWGENKVAYSSSCLCGQIKFEFELKIPNPIPVFQTKSKLIKSVI